MGSKQALSNGNEPEELIDLVEGFQSLNRVSIVITSRLVRHKGKWDLAYSATAVPLEGVRGGACDWASANAIVWGSEFKSLMGLYSSLLYALDFQIAEREWGKTKEQQ